MATKIAKYLLNALASLQFSDSGARGSMTPQTPVPTRPYIGIGTQMIQYDLLGGGEVDEIGSSDLEELEETQREPFEGELIFQMGKGHTKSIY